MPIQFHHDGPWELPGGWVWARLGDVCQINQAPSFDDLPADMEIPFVPMAAVAEETGTIDLSQRRCVSEVRSGYTRFRGGDVLFAKITPCMENGKTAIVPDIPSGYGAGSTEFHTFRSEALDRRYLWYWLVRRAFRADAQGNMRGAVGQLRVPIDYLKDVLIAVPSLTEQRRIVVRIDELFTEIADGEASLNRARDDLEIWRRALLKAAVTGELTREWREQNRTNEPAIGILEALRGSRISLRARGRANDGTSSTFTELPKLPETWSWTTIGELAEAVRNGTSKVPRSTKNNNEILRISSVRPLWVDVGQIRYLDDQQATDAGSFKVEHGDLLFTRYNGSADLVGVGARYRDVPRFYPDKLIRVRLREEVRDFSDFVELAVNTWVSRRHIAANIKTTAGQQGISGESLKATPVPLPPRSEAAAIVRQVQSYDDDIKAEMASVEGDTSRLRQGTLKAAFEGRLVQQDPLDEPADQMLARLGGPDEASIRSRRARQTRRAAASAG